MKKLAFWFVLFTSISFAQTTTFRPEKAGHVFTISLPSYMTKTAGVNNAASIQFKNTIKDIYGIVIYDSKEELKMVDMLFSSVTEFFESFSKDFLKDEEKRTISKPISKKIGNTNFIEFEASYYDKESKIEIAYVIGVVETPTTFYKILCWSSSENKDKYKADFQKIIYSLKD
jgi:hypothetical protein